MEDVRVVFNNYLIIGGYYGTRPRAENEMPWLEETPHGLIALLKQEYPES
jgi:hypothetical protein